MNRCSTLVCSVRGGVGHATRCALKVNLVFQWLLRATAVSAAEDDIFTDDDAVCPHCGHIILRYETPCRWCQSAIDSSELCEWWVDQPEQVELRYGVFDVTMAKRILVTKPRPIHNVSTSEFDHPPPNAIIDAVPLNVPIILGIYFDEPCLIDGRKRIAYAIKKERPSLQAVFLTGHETVAISRPK